MTKRFFSRNPMDILWGLAYAGFAAVAFSLWVAFVTAGKHDEVVAEYGLSPVQIMGTYVAIAAVVGPLLGFLRPALQYRLGAFIVGSLIGVTIYLGIALAMGGLDRPTFIVSSFIGILIGGGLGLVQFDEERKNAGG
jgi:hypothetical protein